MTATTTEAALRHAIAAHPCDDTPLRRIADYYLIDCEPPRPEDARNVLLDLAHRDIIRYPDDVDARLAWAEVAESVPVDEGALAGIECPGCRPDYPCREGGLCRRRAREAALARTAAMHRRAEFVRVQCELASDTGCAASKIASHRISDCPGCRRICRLRERERELLKENVYEWTPPLLDRWPLPRCQLALESDCAVVLYTTMPPESLRVQFVRGFPGHLTCTAEAWFGSDRAPGLCERLWWDAGQTVPCGACGGRKGLSVYERGEYGPNRYFEDCPTCHGSGELPRPIPTTAVPLRKLTLSTMPPPAWMMSSIPRQRMTGPPTAYVGESERKRCLENIAAKCPGLEVVLPG